MMRGKLYYAITGLFTLLLVACGSDQSTESIQIAKGGRTYGGELKFMSSDKVQGLFPLQGSDEFSNRIINQLFEPLFNIDPATLSVVPGVAESFTVNEDYTKYVITVRDNVFFHDDECFGGTGPKVTAKDVEFSLKFACSADPLNKYGAGIVSLVKGADQFHQHSAKANKMIEEAISGIKVKDDRTIEIQLNNSFVGFEKMLAQVSLSIFSKVAFEKYGNEIGKHPVGTGPFKLDKFTDAGVTLVRNPNYWKKDEFGNQLPYLNSITMTYANSKKGEMLAFSAREIDMVLEIPVDEIDNVLGTFQEALDGKNIKHKVESSKSYSINYIGFNHSSETFSNKDVREAFLLATDPKSMVEDYLGGEGYPATNGFVPEMDGFDNKVQVQAYNPEKARQLMVRAGYPNGAGFPALDFYVNAIEGSSVHRMAQAFCTQIKSNLNIDLNIKLCSLADRSDAIESGKAQIWRAGWIADYPDPQSFLSIFSSKEISNNGLNFDSKEFNDNFERAIKERDEAKRIELLNKCAQQLVDDAVVVPILTNNVLVMVNARVKGFVANPMEIIDFSQVYIKEPKETKTEPIKETSDQ